VNDCEPSFRQAEKTKANKTGNNKRTVFLMFQN
jgi:hypothetical protein